MAYKRLFGFSTHATGGTQHVLLTSILLHYHTPWYLCFNGRINAANHQVETVKCRKDLATSCGLKWVKSDPFWSILINIRVHLRWCIKSNTLVIVIVIENYNHLSISEIILGIGLANEKKCYYVTHYLIGPVHTNNLILNPVATGLRKRNMV